VTLAVPAGASVGRGIGDHTQADPWVVPPNHASRCDEDLREGCPRQEENPMNGTMNVLKAAFQGAGHPSQ
jgi:hypothetical protein